MVYRRQDRPSGPALRPLLVAAARQLVEQKGPHDLSAREASRMVGASDMASIAHFPDGLPELLAAVAISGFEMMEVALDAPPLASTPAKRIRDVLHRYVRFGLENANLYRAMFFSRLADKLGSHSMADWSTQRGGDTYMALLQVKAAAFGRFVEPMRALRAEGMLRSKRPEDAGKAAAALAHGLVGEFIDEGIGVGTTSPGTLTEKRLALTDTMTKMLLHGLLAGPNSTGVPRP